MNENDVNDRNDMKHDMNKPGEANANANSQNALDKPEPAKTGRTAVRELDADSDPEENTEKLQTANVHAGATDWRKFSEVIAITIILSTLVLAGTAMYVANTFNTKLISIGSDLNAMKGSLLSLSGAAAGAQKAGQPQQVAAGEPSAQQAGKQYPPSLSISLEGKVARGDASAPITIVEYSDFQCPFCARVEPTLDQVLNDYPGKVNLYYKHFPLTQIHQYAQKAAEASECAADQGKFWEYHDILFDN